MEQEFSRLYIPEPHQCDPRRICCERQENLCCTALSKCFSPAFYQTYEPIFLESSDQHGITEIDHKNVVAVSSFRIVNYADLFAAVEFAMGRAYFPNLAPLTEPESQATLWVSLNYCPFSGDELSMTTDDAVERKLPEQFKLENDAEFCCNRLRFFLTTPFKDLDYTLQMHSMNDQSIPMEAYAKESSTPDACTSHCNLLRENGVIWISSACFFVKGRRSPLVVEDKMNFCIFCGDDLSKFKSNKS